MRKTFGIYLEHKHPVLTASGRNLITRIPEQKHISAGLVRTAMKDTMKACIYEINSLLERTPPEMQRMIKNNGIYICGGLANLSGLPEYMSSALGIKIHSVAEPELCTVNGLKKIIESKELMKMTYSMLDENYRWIR